MSLFKRTKDEIIKILLGKSGIPRGLFDLTQYFRYYGPINFKYEHKGNLIIAVSTNFKYGSIVTSGQNENELDQNIKDAILASFEVPSSYAQEAKVRKTSENTLGEYAAA